MEGESSQNPTMLQHRSPLRHQSHFVDGASYQTEAASDNLHCFTNQKPDNNNLNIVYFNARSLLHKHDELCAVVEADNPDVICIVESWLSTEIHDTEIAICGYHSYRLDRNRHGGGVIVYVRSCFVTTLVPVPSHGLEIISLTVSNGIGKVCISVFYRPPSSPSLIFEDLFLYLQSLNIPEFCNYILLGDFNVNFCNYTHPFYRKLLNIFNSFCLSQVVSEPTHLCSNGSSSMFDLIAMSSPSLFQSCKTISPLSNSDHLELSLQSQWKHASQPQSHPKRIVWRCVHADWQRANNSCSAREDYDEVVISYEVSQHARISLSTLDTGKATGPDKLSALC